VIGPDSILLQSFDIQAKLPEGANEEQVPAMLQTLLAERFALRVHREERETDVYVLLVGSSGPKLKQAEAGAPPSANPHTAGPGERALAYVIEKEDGSRNTISRLNGARMVFEGTKVKMAELAETIGRYVERPVVDQTKLEGYYEIAMDVPRLTALVVARIAADDTASQPDTSIFASVQKLGLRLERKRVPLDFLVIDHIDRTPSDN